METDVVIIGGGVVGAAVARVLSRSCLDVILFEKADDICMGASKANSGIVHAGYDAEPGTLKARFNVEGARMYPVLCRELGVPFAAVGALVIGFTDEDRATLERLLAQGMANGVADLAIIGGSKALALEPNLNPEVRFALHIPSGGIVSPYEMTYALMDHAVVNGVKVILNEKVALVRREEAGYRVQTARRRVHARAVINCAGMGAAAIHRMLVKDNVSFTPRRGEYHLLDRALQPPFSRTIFQCPTMMGKGVLISPTVHGNTFIGPTAADISDGEDTATTAAALSEALAKSKLTWPDVNTRAGITAFAGVRAHDHSGDFMIAQPLPGYFAALGIESPGLTAAPAIGESLGKDVSEYLGAAFKETFLPPPFRPKPFHDMTGEERERAWQDNPLYGAIVCRCECVTEAEIVQAIHRPVGASNVDAVKRRTRAGMGRCQGGFCSPRVVEILSRELDIPALEVTKCGGESRLLTGLLQGGER